MIKKVKRNYLEINSIKDLSETYSFPEKSSVNLVKSADFQLNKFFYKSIGKKHNWVDRLIWTEKQWEEYTTNKNVKTYVLKIKEDIAGYF